MLPPMAESASAPTPLAPARDGAERLAWLHVAGWHGSSRCAGDDLDDLLRRATIARNKLAAAGLDPDEEPGA